MAIPGIGLDQAVPGSDTTRLSRVPARPCGLEYQPQPSGPGDQPIGLNRAISNSSLDWAVMGLSLDRTIPDTGSGWVVMGIDPDRAISSSSPDQVVPDSNFDWAVFGYGPD